MPSEYEYRDHILASFRRLSECKRRVGNMYGDSSAAFIAAEHAVVLAQKEVNSFTGLLADEIDAIIAELKAT